MLSAALQADIVAACATHEKNNEQNPYYTRAFRFQNYFIKYGEYATFDSEAMTLKYLADLAAQDPEAPRVPRVHHYFYKHGGMAYVVMEYIPLVEVPMEVRAKAAAQAVLWMRSIPVPEDVVLGPKGGGPAYHVIFKNAKAPRRYTSIRALERFLNKALGIVRYRRSVTLPDFDIVNEPLVLTQSDMNCGNFGVDTDGRPVILDACEIGWLPESLDLFNLFNTTAFARAIAQHVFTPEQAAAWKSILIGG